MTQIKKMFAYEGKTTKLIGATRTKIYEELYNYISEKQTSSKTPLPVIHCFHLHSEGY